MDEALRHFMDRWTLSDPEPLARTSTSDLYRVRAAGKIAVLKMLSKAGMEDEGAAVAHDLLAEQDPLHILHGGTHHENIRHTGRGWLALDPKGLIGDRAYDAANALCNPRSLPKTVQDRNRLLRQAEIMTTALKLSRDRLLRSVFAHACLSACWSMEDGHDPDPALAMANLAETCITSEEARPTLRGDFRIPSG